MIEFDDKGRIIVPIQANVGAFIKMEKFKGKPLFDQEGEHICGEFGNHIIHVTPGTRKTVADWFPCR
jgi:hypothetical protein